MVGGAWSFIAITSRSLRAPELGVRLLSLACLQALSFSKDVWINKGPKGGGVQFGLFSLFFSKNPKPTIQKETCSTPI